MSTKTISIDLEAYELLRRLKAGERDSFSRIIKRVIKGAERGTGQQYLSDRSRLPSVDDKVIEKWDSLEDSPPDDPWGKERRKN